MISSIENTGISVPLKKEAEQPKATLEQLFVIDDSVEISEEGQQALDLLRSIPEQLESRQRDFQRLQIDQLRAEFDILSRLEFLVSPRAFTQISERALQISRDLNRAGF